MQERCWTPDQVDAIDVDEWGRIVAYEVVRLYEANRDAPSVTPDQLRGGGRS